MNRDARAQATRSGAPRKIGYLELGADPDPTLPGPQRQGASTMRKLGWIEGENVLGERAFADLDVGRLAGLATELVRKGAKVMIPNGSDQRSFNFLIVAAATSISS